MDANIGHEEFERIYTEYNKRMYAYFLSRTGNVHDSEDLTANVFLKLYTRYSLFDAEKSKFDVWFFRLARNTVIDFYRTTKSKTDRTVVIDEAIEISSGASPEIETINNEQNKILANAIKLLPDKKREIVTLKYISGLKNYEIAEIVGTSENNISVVLHRALKELDKILSKQGFDML